MIHALHGLNIYGLYVDEEYTSKSKNYLYSINPFTWEIQDLVDNLSDYDCNEIGTVAALVRLKDSDDDLISNNSLTCSFATVMGEPLSQSNNKNEKDMFIYLINNTNSSSNIKKGKTNFEIDTNMNILAMFEYNRNNSACQFGNNNNNNLIALLGFTNNFNNNTISVGIIDINDGSLIDIIYTINDTLLLTYNVALLSQIAFSSNLCRFNVIMANIKDFYNKRAMMIINLANEYENYNYSIIKDNNDYDGILLVDSLWYSMIENQEMLVGLFEDQNSQKLEYIKQVTITNNNTKIELDLICNIKFNNQLYFPAIYGWTTSPYAYYKDYLFYIGNDENLDYIAFSMQITNNQSNCINLNFSYSIPNTNKLKALVA